MFRVPNICLVWLVFLVPMRVFAQVPANECSEYVPAEERQDAQRLAMRGVDCFEAGQYTVALRHYRRARTLSDANLLNAALGRTFQELGYPAIARRYYRDYLRGKIEDSEGRAKIEARLEAVETALKSSSRVRIESSPPGATVFVIIDGNHWEELGDAPLDLDMRAGKHSFVIQREGYVTHTAQVDVGTKQHRIVRAELVEDGAAFAVSGQRLRRSGIIAMGASVPFLIAGPALYFVGRNQRGAVDELPVSERPDATKRAVALQNWGIVSTVVGTAALGTGLALYLVGSAANRPDDDSDPESEPSSHVLPYTDGRTAGFVWVF